MDYNGSKKCNSSRKKPFKRRPHTRKPPQDGSINMAEVRRAIAHALHLHRSSSSSSSSCKPIMVNDDTHDHHELCCYSLLESIPIPQPIGSTTEPAVMPPPTFEDVEEFEWWIGFLKNLDGNIMRPLLNNNHVMGNCMMFGSECFQDGSKHGETCFVNASDFQISSVDEWLVLVPYKDEVFIAGNCVA